MLKFEEKDKFPIFLQMMENNNSKLRLDDYNYFFNSI